MSYVDGFVLTVSDVPAYRRIATRAGKVWKDHGALSYFECAGDDLDSPGVAGSFRKLVKVKPGETVVFAFIVYKSRAHRDKVNAKVMADKRMQPPKDAKAMPFDMKRMYFGGFKTIVEY